jgi:hypothetical protein
MFIDSQNLVNNFTFVVCRWHLAGVRGCTSYGKCTSVDQLDPSIVEASPGQLVDASA